MKKSSGYCSQVVGQCVGASHCSYYKESEKYILSSVVENKKEFSGIKMIAMSDIEVGDKFVVPGDEKIEKIKKIYKETGKIDKPIIVSCHGKKYKLEDKFLRYYVAELLDLREIPAKICNKSESGGLRVGTELNHVRYGIGKVVRINGDKIEVLFESGNKAVFNIDFCVKGNLIAVIKK